MDLRPFVWGMIAGIIIFVVALSGAAHLVGVKLQPVMIEQTK